MFPGEKWLVQHMAIKVLFPEINMILGHASEMLCEPSLSVTANINKNVCSVSGLNDGIKFIPSPRMFFSKTDTRVNAEDTIIAGLL